MEPLSIVSSQVCNFSDYRDSTWLISSHIFVSFQIQWCLNIWRNFHRPTDGCTVSKKWEDITKNEKTWNRSISFTRVSIITSIKIILSMIERITWCIWLNHVSNEILEMIQYVFSYELGFTKALMRTRFRGSCQPFTTQLGWFGWSVRIFWLGVLFYPPQPSLHFFS